MTFTPPAHLSPSSVATFMQCPLQYRFSKVQHLPEPPSVAAEKGVASHKALELVMQLPPAERSRDRAQRLLADVRASWNHGVFDYFKFDDAQTEAFWSDCSRFVDGYFQMEDPRQVLEPETEVKLKAKLGRATVYGVVDRIERDENGGLVITDYKSGKPPHPNYTDKPIRQLEYYAALVRELRDELATTARLYFIAHGERLATTPTNEALDRLIARTDAVWTSVEESCASGNFAATRNSLCNFCAFKPWCPEFGGNPDRAADEAPLKYPKRFN